MTAITTVPAPRRWGQVTPYLLAAVAIVAAVSAWLLLGTHTAFAGDRSAPHRSGGQAETATGRQIDRGENSAQRTVQEAAPRSQSPASDAPARSAARFERPAHPQPHADRRPSEGQASLAPLTAREVAKVPATEHPRQVGVQAQPEPPHTASPKPEEPVAVRPAAEQGHSEARPDERAAALRAAKDQDQPAAPASPVKQQPAAIRSETCPTTSHLKVTAATNQPAPAPVRLKGLSLVATPSQAVAPIFALTPPTPNLQLPGTARPAAPSQLPAETTPQPAGALVPRPTRQPSLSANPLVSHLQSAVTVGALWLLVPLLTIVLLFQVRLMRQMRSLRAGSAKPATRHYSVTQDEVRALAPDMLPALAHHRFCESLRHQGRWRLAKWLELEDTDSDVPLMWATCDTCHHQRMTLLRNGHEVAVSHD
jgi:hypothetical protein